ncbi:unnamed protein product [Tuber aestivum]|uniref:BZIP domain-containing protein n=1 Tax=Tuber aestivum TaxID=59557 RepID=A0A292PXE9_9PEZI|nr:unnamed protein product [Tuber aestivum]
MDETSNHEANLPQSILFSRNLSLQKSQMPESRTKKDAQRALRIRDTKRRQRARQKEYTAELEQRLRALEAQGVQATVEMQLSARRVAGDNERLRKLLRTIGVDEDVINGWNEGQEVSYRATSIFKVKDSENDAGGQKDKCPARVCKSNTAKPQQCQELPPLPAECGPPTPPAHCQSKAPCKLARALAEDPHTDIAQLPIPAESEAEAKATPGKTPCGKAAQMLLQFATSDEKLEALAGILEEGCVQNGEGGCSVENNVVLEALDRVCI